MTLMVNDDLLDRILDEEQASDQADAADSEPEDPALLAEADPPEDGEPTGNGATRGASGLVTVRDLLGIPLFYERRPGPPRPAAFDVMPSFKTKLEATLRDLRQRAPEHFGPLVRISSAGIFTAKAGAHGNGRAMDWDRLVFENVEIAPLSRDHASLSHAKRRRYWAFAALCRANSSFVLHGRYNAVHTDHIHQDDVAGLGFNPGSFAAVTLAQSVLNEIFGESPKLAVDGAWGSASRAAFARAQARLQLEGSIEDTSVWLKFLRAGGRLGLQMQG